MVVLERSVECLCSLGGNKVNQEDGLARIAGSSNPCLISKTALCASQILIRVEKVTLRT